MRIRFNEFTLCLTLILGVMLVAPHSTAAQSAIQPNLARGEGTNKILDRQQFDSVDLFNGNIHLSYPLGLTYPLSNDFSYRLALHYNSNIWDFRQASTTITSTPMKHSNAGIGWDLSLGRLIDPFASDNSLRQWVYISPDGTLSPFYQTLHANVAEADDNVFYTRDSSYLRLKQTDSSTVTIEEPNGVIKFFNLLNGEWHLVKIADRFTNYLAISYATPNVWTLSDSQGRTQSIYFKSDPTGVSPRLVDRVEVAAFNGGRATYTFAYATAAITRPGIDNDAATPNTITVSQLSSISAPDRSRHVFGYDQRVPAIGRLSSMVLPTKGRIEWTYQTYSFTSTGCATPLSQIYRTNVGLATRYMADAAGTNLGGWTYTPGLQPLLNSSGGCVEERGFTNTVRTPVQDKTVYYFSVNTQGAGPAWWKSDYGIPGTKDQFDATASRILSRQDFDCDAEGNNCQLLRSKYVRYEQDFAPDPAMVDVINANRREASERIVYHDDLEGGVEHYADTDKSEFDGLGNWRRVRTNGNFGSGDVAESYVGYDASTGNYPSAAFRLPLTTAPWLTKTYNIWKRQEGQSARVIEFCFDRNTGALSRTRLWKSTDPNGAAGVNDVLIVNNWNTAGQLVREQYYGGDIQNLDTASICSARLPTADQYQVRHSYQFGVLNYSQFFDERGIAIGPRTVDITVDRNTGLAKSRRDLAGLTTSYEYDWKGRETFIKPPSGHDAQTQHRYLIATGAQWEGERIVTNHLPNAGGSILTEFITTLDSFGQPWAQQQYMADGTYSTRFRYYNALGWVTQESELSSGDPKFTSFLNCDPFGRPRVVRPPDGQHHDTTYQYAGIRSVKKTVSAAVSYNASTGAINEAPKSTTTVYDRQGRLWQTIRHAGSQSANSRDIVTINSYNVAGETLSVRQDGQPLSPVYSYDGRGFKTGEYDSSENQTLSYQNIDAKGNALRTARTYNWNSTTVSFDSVYDRVGRPIRIQETNDPSKVLKEFEYAPANGTNDWRAGKLWKTKRYNDMSRFLGVHGVNTAVVSETYTYGGVGGRLSQYDVELSDSLGRYEKFIQSYAYTEIGDIRETGYPNGVVGSSVTVGRERKVLNSYSAGWLTGISGTYNSQAEAWANPITYHSNGLVNRMTHSNGVTDIIANDSNGFTRPASVSTSGAKNPSTNSPDNLNSGDFQYDGEGRLVRTGSNYLVNEQGFVMPTIPPTPSSYLTPCDDGYRDTLNFVYAFTDRQCTAKAFYYYTASDRLYKMESGLNGQETKTWYFYDQSGRLLTEYATAHAHYQPWPSIWQFTRDYIYRGDALLAIDEKRRDEPNRTPTHYHIGHGAKGGATDGNGYRLN